MTPPQHLDDILRDWPYDPDEGAVRLTEGEGGREVLQMRIDLGVLQLETTDRPDGLRPGGFATMREQLTDIAAKAGEGFLFSEEQCLDADREFVQFYHRRVCWLQLARYEMAVRDADHTLAMMDLCALHSPDERWTLTHEQYRPFVLYHRTQASALAALERSGAEEAVEEMNAGLERLRELFAQFEVEEHFDENDLVVQLTKMREQLREEYQVGRTLQERLQDAVSAEQYELAAEIRDLLDRRHEGGGKN
ncbi:UvrB/UvrC motif-containing protein [Lignipirellula cremea]|uniref:UVR domain-containing protein n=1 Tax=Lignipirellula cremea TaxID=2528010 RepID=A0A518E1G9_9BACT|nr:UvrB/UvrC motif-containing protein [Lignipirellula cremea]QDU97945.1 hypothetical protein Pla8534_58040 [Lignipirellula cremea]